jgi:IMP dehydrogenase
MSSKRGFVPIVDDNMILQKLAFLQKYDTNFIGIAIGTRGDWKAEINKWAPQVDTLCTDSSNICFEDSLKILEYVKSSRELRDKPFGFGNIIQGRHYKSFAEAGADYLIAGMGVGSICKTGSKRGNARGQMTVALEIAKERDEYFEKTGRYVPFVLDGGIETVHEMTVALAMADFIMMGNYFNRFYESAARKFRARDGNKEPTFDEAIDWVETWGEGHPRARLVAMCGIDLRRGPSETGVNGGDVVARYGHSSVSAATVEGVLGYVKYRGRLKPCVEEDARYIKTTIQNVGAENLKSYRDKVRKYQLLEKADSRTLRDMLPHDLEIAAEE